MRDGQQDGEDDDNHDRHHLEHLQFRVAQPHGLIFFAVAELQARLPS